MVVESGATALAGSGVVCVARPANSLPHSVANASIEPHKAVDSVAHTVSHNVAKAGSQSNDGKDGRVRRIMLTTSPVTMLTLLS